MSDVEQRARDALNEVFGSGAYAAEDKRSRYREVEAMCRQIEAHDATKAEFSEAMRELDARLADMGLQEVSKARSIARCFILPKPVDPLVEALKASALFGIEQKHADNLRAELAKRGLTITQGEPQ